MAGTIRMRERITLKQLSITTDGAGGYTSSDSTIGTYWAKVSRLGATGQTEEGKEYLQDAVVFTVRYDAFTISNIDDFTITWNSKVYKINAVENIGERDTFLKIVCTNEN